MTGKAREDLPISPTSDQVAPGRVAAQAGRGKQDVERVTDDPDPEQPEKRDLLEVGVLDDAPGAGLKEQPAGPYDEDHRELGPEARDAL